MPALGESVTEGTVTRWLKQEGDQVEVDEPLLEVSTDKVDTEIPSPAAGVLERIVAGEDETVEVGGELAVIGERATVAQRGGSDERRRPAGRRAAGRRSGLARPRRATPRARASAVADRSGGEEPAGSRRPRRSPTGSGHAVKMPELGESVTEGTVTRWLKQVGDRVEVDEPLLEVSTDKVDTEIPSPVAGTLLEITAGEDETVEVGAELAVIGDAVGGQRPAGGRARAQPSGGAGRKSRGRAEAEAESRRAPKRAEAEPHPAADGRARRHPRPAGAAPATSRGRRAAVRAGRRPERHPTRAQARRRALRRPLGHHRVRGGWPHPQAGRPRRRRAEGRGTSEAEAAAAPAEAPAAARPRPVAAPHAGPRRRPQPGTRSSCRACAGHRPADDRVAAGVGPAHHRQEVDVTRIARLRAQVKAEFERREGVKLTFLPFFAKAAIEALKEYPRSTRRSTSRERRSSTTATCTWRSPSTPPAACSSR